MSDIGELYKVLDKEKQKEKETRRNKADDDYDQAKSIAGLFGMDLIRHSNTHYSLRHPQGWILNIYPGNRRLYRDQRAKVKSPYIRLKPDWDLLDVIEQIARAELRKANNKKKSHEK